MKKQFLILISTVLFAILFYNQELGLNLSIFALFLLVIQLVMQPKLMRDKRALLLTGCIVVTCISNAWLLSFSTFIAVMISSFVFRYYLIDPQLKLVTQAFNFLLNWPAFVVHVFLVDTWLEFKEDDSKKTFVTIFAYIILPVIILSVFFGLYVSSSEMLSNWYNRYEFNIDGLIILVLLFGFFISFVFWYLKVFDFLKLIDRTLKTNFSKSDIENIKPTFDFIPLQFEVRSGIITLTSLNAMLLFFVIVFNIENAQQSIQQLSDYSNRTHNQIYLIIVSVFLAMLVVLFFFKGALNFIKGNKWLLLFTKIWIVLNTVLLISAFYQNSVYINALGLTYKRLGVYLFLILCGIGLIFSFLKIQDKKTNFYLIDKMSWTLFYSLIFCSIFNWSSIITTYNLQKDTIDLQYLVYELNGNEKDLIPYFKKHDMEIPEDVLTRLNYYENLPFLSKQLYYELSVK